MNDCAAAEPIYTTPLLPRMPATHFIVRLARAKAMLPLAILGALLVIFILLGCLLDMRLLIIGLMIPAIILPMVMAFLYFSYALSPRCLPCVHPHQIEFYHHSLTICYLVSAPVDGHPEAVRRVRVDVPRADVSGYTVHPEGITIFMRAPFGMLLIPADGETHLDFVLNWVRDSNHFGR